jgi:hypothetical protein
MSRVPDIENKRAWSSDFFHRCGIAMDTPIFINSDSGRTYIFRLMTTNITMHTLKLRFQGIWSKQFPDIMNAFSTSGRKDK